jgi:hypothetical protein
MEFIPLYFNGKQLVVGFKDTNKVKTIYLSSIYWVKCEGKAISVGELIDNITLPNKALNLKYYFDNVKFKYFIQILVLKLRYKIKSYL